MVLDIFSYRLLQLRDAFEHAIPDTVLGNVAEPAFDDIQPRTACRCEVNVKSLVTLQPVLHLGVLVSGVVVHN